MCKCCIVYHEYSAVSVTKQELKLLYTMLVFNSVMSKYIQNRQSLCRAQATPPIVNNTVSMVMLSCYFIYTTAVKTKY